MTRFLPAMLAGLAVFLAAGCGGTGGTGAGGSTTGAGQAGRLHSRVETAYSLQRDGEVLDLIRTLAGRYPGYSRCDEVLVMGVGAARRLDDTDAALALTDRLLQRHPHSSLVDPALLQGAELAVAAGDTLRACSFLLAYHDRAPNGGTAPPRQTSFFHGLGADDLAELGTHHANSELAPWLGYLRTRALLVQARYPAATDQVARLEASAPEADWTVRARALLSAPTTALRRPLPTGGGAVSAGRIGVLAPLTGRYALLGNAYVDACMLAVVAANAEADSVFELQVEDTAGDPVVAALAARRLCAEGGSIALVGAMLSSTTATAAVVADQWQVPVVSPTATNDRVWELGGGIYQPNLTSVYEIRLLAELLVPVLLKERVAILHPDDPEGRRHAEVFRTEIESVGGEIVHVAAFAPRSTDFRAPILAVRETRPEVIFVPASVDQMALVAPQLDFYRCGSLVVGLSGFNSPRLLERAGTVLEGLVFPDDLALFPASWTAEFNTVWAADEHPQEATALALKVYQATRMLLDTLQRSGAAERSQLTAALGLRLANRDVDAAGPESFAETVRLVRKGEIARFPAEVYRESWELTEGALADSLAAAAADTVGSGYDEDLFEEE
ncbi:MAG: amino acid ABC transporter substrate-binding protein [bacterium]|nr:amino acid ABC transporter substrate-binding protein [bacterium]